MRSARSRLLSTTLLAAPLAVLMTTLVAPAADAHVRAFADSTTTGGFSAVTFRVPNESDTAGTVKVAVQLPQDHPLIYVSSKPVAGWTVAMTEEALPQPVDFEGTTITKAVRTVTWTATGGTRISPGEYQEFSLSVGPLPAPGTVLLPATQTYSDGEVVTWDQATPASGQEPEHPAPEIVITAAEAASPTASPAPEVAAAPTGGDTVARVLAGAALLVAVAGAGIALARRPRVRA